jgi:hypothetical protein
MPLRIAGLGRLAKGQVRTLTGNDAAALTLKDGQQVKPGGPVPWARRAVDVSGVRSGSRV